MNIVAFVGVVGSGKDYQANLLVQRDYARVDFKDELLDMASDLVGYDVRADYDWFKTHIVGMVRKDPTAIREKDAIDSAALEDQHPLIMTGRRLLQRLGTDVMRKRDQNYWIKAWEQKVARLGIISRGIQGVVCADCRFPNEVEAVAALGGRLVFCDYRSQRYNAELAHESERLAQELRRLGLKDLETITEDHYNAVLERIPGGDEGCTCLGDAMGRGK